MRKRYCIAALLALALIGCGIVSQNRVQDDDVRFVAGVYDKLEIYFYDSEKVKPAPLFQAALRGIGEFLGQKNISFIPVDIPQSDTKGEALQKFADELFRARHLLGGKKADGHELAFSATAAMLASLDDSHTYLVPPSSFDPEKSVQGDGKKFVGIGVTFRQSDPGFLYIEWVVPGSPAAKAGLKRFDRIVAIDSKPPDREDVIASVKRIWLGEEGSVVTLTIERPGTPKSLVLNVERHVIENIVFDIGVVTDDKGRNFSCVTIRRFTDDRIIDRLEAIAGDVNNTNGVIIDVRECPGGYTEIVKGLASLLLKDETHIFTLRDRRTGERKYFTERTCRKINAPVVVLINARSFSGSELLAAVLQENCRATVVGEKTLGRLSVAYTLDLPYNATMYVTCNQLVTAGSVIIEKNGVIPDVEAALTKEDIRAGRDVQLEKAMEVLVKIAQ